LHLNESIEWHCMQTKLNWNSVQFNSTIGLKFNWIEKKIDYKLVKKILKIYSWIWYWKKNDWKNTPFMPCYLGTN
jgi:hypothetical protein